ncbi:SGNH/GDSL hydrolase family protein [Streptomyces sp. SLBN-118]|uniref:SGNH/GDSL hydrolase family protein n=1 Tax=Streptomyces sp. SLBN-118 TaxID=2768454 RepID=UPI001152125E|nr:SGNH/GDSL hydrolase family protein [Streptomyces sp. SLBN-118]
MTGYKGMCLDVRSSNNNNGTAVQLYTCNGTGAQQWTAQSNGTFRALGKCMDVAGGAKDNGTLVQLYDCNGTGAQVWEVQSNGALRNPQSGRCLDDPLASPTPGTQLQIYDCNGTDAQKWQFSNPGWKGAWAAAPCSNGPAFTNQTIRMVVHSTTAGWGARVRLTNRYGTAPLAVGAVTIATRSSGGTVAYSQTVFFNGATSVSIPAGGDRTSDLIGEVLDADQSLLVSIYLPGSTGPSTWHPEAHETTYIASGNHVNDTSTANYSGTSTSWYFLDGLDVFSGSQDKRTLVAVGDSITDGSGSTTGAEARWPDDLARRLNANATPLGVVNAGIGANRVLTSTATPVGGGQQDSLVTRFSRDVLDQPGVKSVILLEGINDIGNSQVTTQNTTIPSAQDIIAGYQKVIGQAHAEGIKIYGGTILPDKGSGYYNDARETTRQAVNTWIRTPGSFDGFVDFDAAIRDPSNLKQMKPAYDSGDHLHPSDMGYQAMANAVDLDMITR